MIIRTLLIWLLLLTVAVLNGVVREAFLVPLFGTTAGQVTSTLLLVVLIAATAYVMLPQLRLRRVEDAWRVGATWLALTLAFEFLAGHFLFGHSWESLLSEYDVADGRLWALVPVVTLVAPVIIHLRRRPLPPSEGVA